MSTTRKMSTLAQTLPTALRPITAAAVVGGVAATAAVAIGAQPASAACSTFDCVFVWEHDNREGAVGDIHPTQRGNLSARLEDKVSSYLNNSKSWAYFFEHDNYRGWDLCAAPGAESRDLSNLGGIEDEMSSYIATSALNIPEIDGGCDIIDAN